MVVDDQDDVARVRNWSVQWENLVPCVSYSLDKKLGYVLLLYRDLDHSYRRRRRGENRLIVDRDRVGNYLTIDQSYVRVHLQDPRRNDLENVIITIDRQEEKVTKTRVLICWLSIIFSFSVITRCFRSIYQCSLPRNVCPSNVSCVVFSLDCS